FLARETGGRQGRVASYSLRRYDAGVALRHRTRDLEIFHELVVADAYHPPAPVIGLMTTLRRPVILDLGANIGLFGVMSRAWWPAAQVIAYEPDRNNLEVLEHCRRLAGAEQAWRIVPAFAANENG